MRKSKNGSSLITVVIIFGLLAVIGTVTLSLTASDYNMRVGESKKTKNLYYSESGIDLTYGVVGKITERAITKGNEAVNTFMDSLNGASGILEIERQKVKNKEITEGNFVNADGTVNEDKIKQQQNNIFKTEYKKYFTDVVIMPDGKKISRIIYAIENSLYFKDVAGTDTEVKVNFSTNEKPSISVAAAPDASGDRIIGFSALNKLDLNINSTFETATTMNASVANLPFKRTINVSFSIITPNYNDTYFVETKKLQVPINPVWKKSIAVDGDLNVNGNLEVDGDIFVKGNENAVADKAYDKYKGGILIQSNNSDEKNVSLKGTVVTAKSFSVKGRSNVTIDNGVVNTSYGKLYANNVYVGKSSSTDSDSVGTKLTVNGPVYTDNDLALNSKSSEMTISKFYGMDDLNITKDPTSSRASYGSERVSSSILINTDDIGETNGSSLTIKDEAYIMGTAYIKTNPTYQTGESVAVKGNYVAYASELNSDSAKNKNLDKSKVYFGYYNPLQLVDSFDKSDTEKHNDMIFEDKSNYIKIYSEEGNNVNNLKLKGVSLPENTISIGTFITKEGASYVLKSPTYNLKSEEEVKAQKESFTTEVFEMGNSKGISDLMDKYTKGVVEKTVANQVNFSQINTATDVNADSNGDRIVLNNSASKKVIIEGTGASKDGESGNIAIDLSAASGKFNGIIVTAGDVEIRGTLDFKGTIIAGGSLTMAGDTSNKKFTYDTSYVEKLIAYKYSTFEKLFDTSNPLSKDYIEISADVASAEEDAGHSIITDKLISKGMWKILK